MIREAEYLISLCKAYLYGEELSPDTALDYELLYKIARTHNLSAAAFTVMNTSSGKELIPAQSLKRFEDDFYESVIRYDAQGAVMTALDGLLSEKEIPHIFFKGAVIRDSFPVPEARVMGDIDVLIKPEKRSAVKALLE
ncbi:MAG: nucleotidyltransferase family protein [Eubacterium sp.]|nr:nucleotidyltransferase family protein [Eubacterium sp.]